MFSVGTDINYINLLLSSWLESTGNLRVGVEKKSVKKLGIKRRGREGEEGTDDLSHLLKSGKCSHSTKISLG